MLKVFKDKVREQQLSAPKIDISLVLSEGLKTTSDGPVSILRNAMPVSVASVTSAVALPSSESSFCSINNDGGAGETSSHSNSSCPHHRRRSSLLPESSNKIKRASTPVQYEMQVTHPDSRSNSSSNSSSIPEATATAIQEKVAERPLKKLRGEETKPLLLLGRNDGHSSSRLKPLHAFIRQQIEVFAATPIEIAQPAPGRKQPIQVGQVGLRCRFCRHLPVRNRVKRAVCYPSKVKKIYHSVSDMKFAHFTECQEIPPEIRAMFDALKEEAKTNGKNPDKKSQKPKGESSYSTAKYYEESAMGMGMVDGPSGIFMLQDKSPAAKDGNHALSGQPTPVPLMKAVCKPIEAPKPLQASTPDDSVCPKSSCASSSPHNISAASLATSEDAEYLNPLHCFVRRHLEIFAANEADVAAPAPGRKTRVVPNQVGLRCIHCAKLPAKDRVKRAVCYPPNIQGIYHAVSNMKFDHFAICPSLPLQDREEFDTLRNSTVRRGVKRSSESSKSGRSSTADYYEKAALAKGLVDTDNGIRFATTAVQKEKAKEYKSVVMGPALSLSGLSALAMAACHAV